jgi:hypothetical protein
MSPKNTAILFLVAAALAVFVWFYEIEGGQQREEAEEASKHLFPDVEASDIEAISLHTTDGSRVRVRRVDDVWRIATPIDFAADAFAIDGLASSLASIQGESTIEEPRELAVYGLDAEEGSVRFDAGGVEHVLRTGNDTPVGSQVYASVEGQDTIHIVASHRVQSLRKAFSDLRDKRIANFDTNAVAGLTLTWPEGRVVLERDEAGWKIRAPIQARADDTTVDELLGALSFLRADGFVDSAQPDAETGLDQPVFAAKIQLGGEGAQTLQVEIGGPGPGDATRLVRGAEQSLYTIADTRLDIFPTGLDAYRHRQLAEFSALDAQRVTFGFTTADGTTVGISATRGDDGWTSEPEAFAPGKLDALVTELSRLRADSILADGLGADELAAVGLDPAAALIRVLGEGDAELAQLHLGAPGPDGVPARTSEAPTVFRLRPEAAEQIPVSYEAFLNRFAAEEPLSETDMGAAADAAANPLFETAPASDPPLAPAP